MKLIKITQKLRNVNIQNRIPGSVRDESCISLKYITLEWDVSALFSSLSHVSEHSSSGKLNFVEGKTTSLREGCGRHQTGQRCNAVDDDNHIEIPYVRKLRQSFKHFLRYKQNV